MAQSWCVRTWNAPLRHCREEVSLGGLWGPPWAARQSRRWSDDKAGSPKVNHSPPEKHLPVQEGFGPPCRPRSPDLQPGPQPAEQAGRVAKRIAAASPLVVELMQPLQQVAAEQAV